MDRRDLLQGLAMGGVGLSMGGSALAAAEAPIATASLPRMQRPAADILKPAVMNVPRARAVMAELKLDGLIALNPINVRYLTNTMPILTRMGVEVPAFATFPAREDAPPFLVTSASNSWALANKDRDAPALMPFTYTAAGVARDPGGTVEPPAGKSSYFFRDDLPLTPREKGWEHAQAEADDKAGASPIWALARALKASGMAKGRVAVDDMAIAWMLQQIGMNDVVCVPGQDVFRRIRMVKTASEIERLRWAGPKNAEAARATIASIERGMRFDEIEHRFRTEAALRGLELVFVLAGVTQGLFPDGEAVPGKPFLVDAVSEFDGYHGDFARTVTVGEPSRDVMKRIEANAKAREAVFEMVKPGVTFGQIREVGRTAAVKAGMDERAVIVGPHSVGLQHADQPSPAGLPAGAKDIVLEPGMTITVDLPWIEVGVGAGHNEDLMLITQTGFELLTVDGGPLVVV